MDTMPWNYYGRRTPAARGTLEVLDDARGRARAQAPTTPARNHFYIHAVEASPDPSAP